MITMMTNKHIALYSVLLNACLNRPQLAICRAGAYQAIVCLWACRMRGQ